MVIIIDSIKSYNPQCKKAPIMKLVRIAGLLSVNWVINPSAQASAIFVNEVHYDNKTLDSGEAIEVAGPAGTNLSGWNLVLYNGANGSVYDTKALSGTIPDQQNDVGTMAFSFPTNGIQNGAPDGIALVDAGNNVVQFLSYEGAFVAADGPASGMTSTDIGVTESSTTPFGFSMQLVGTGRESGDFTWSSSLPDTFGSLNNPTAGPTDLFFSEYIEGSSDNKALEIFNGTGNEIDLDNYMIQIYFNGNTSAGSILSLSGMLSDGGLWVVADDNADENILDVANQVFIDTNFFNGNDAVALWNTASNELIDVIGQIGFDPGSEWSGGGIGTQNETLRRISTIYQGDSDGSNAFDPSVQWIGFALNEFSGLGAHSFDPPTTPLATQTILQATVSVPEPATYGLIGIALALFGFRLRL